MNQSIYPSIYLYTFIYIYTFLLSSSIVGKSMKKKNLLLLEKPGIVLLKNKNTKQKMILVVEKLAIALYGPFQSLVSFSKAMVRQRIKTNYCLKDLVTVWMTKTQKTWICCLKQLGSILLNKKKASMKY